MLWPSDKLYLNKQYITTHEQCHLHSVWVFLPQGNLSENILIDIPKGALPWWLNPFMMTMKINHHRGWTKTYWMAALLQALGQALNTWRKPKLPGVGARNWSWDLCKSRKYWSHWAISPEPRKILKDPKTEDLKEDMNHLLLLNKKPHPSSYTIKIKTRKSMNNFLFMDQTTWERHTTFKIKTSKTPPALNRYLNCLVSLKLNLLFRSPAKRNLHSTLMLKWALAPVLKHLFPQQNLMQNKREKPSPTALVNTDAEETSNEKK